MPVAAAATSTRPTPDEYTGFRRVAAPSAAAAAATNCLADLAAAAGRERKRDRMQKTPYLHRVLE